ncbi:GAF domain-containing protein [bacterium]|nr:GAF domain-containing protein [bacterium]
MTMAVRSREERLEALIAIGRKLAAELEPDGLLHSIVESATQLLGATSGSLMTLSPTDGVTLDIRVAVGFNTEKWKALKLRRGQGITGWVAEIGQPLLVPDVSQDARYYPLDASIHSELAVPLILGGRVIGVLNVDSTRLSAFQEEDVELLSALAAHSAAVLRNAELYQESRNHARMLRALLSISGSLTSSLEREEILNTVVARTTQLMRVKMCALFLLDESGTALYPETAYGCSPRYLESRALSLENSLLGQAARERRPVLSLNVRTDPRYHQPDLAREEGLYSLLAAPMVFQGKLLGVLCVYSAHPHVFTQSEEEILCTLADLSSAALANARLHRQVVEAEEQRVRLEKLSALGEVAAGLAHEIRNPLAVMKMLLHGLSSEAPPGSSQSEDLEILSSKVAEISGVVNQLLLLARPVPLERHPLQLSELVQETLGLVRHRLRENHIELETELAEGPPVVGDKGRLSQLLLNLILNSCDAMPHGGRLCVRLSYTECGVPLTNPLPQGGRSPLRERSAPSAGRGGC